MRSGFGSAPVFLYSRSTDMRKSYEGLGGLVESAFSGELLSGALFVFTNKRGNMIKVLYWDEDGFAIWSKRLERGRFRLPASPGNCRLTRRQLSLLLEGVEPLRLSPRYDAKTKGLAYS